MFLEIYESCNNNNNDNNLYFVFCWNFCSVVYFLFCEKERTLFAAIIIRYSNFILIHINGTNRVFKQRRKIL